MPRVIRWDEPDYLWLGKNLLSGQGYQINGVAELHYTPLFPILAGSVYWLTGDPELGSAFWYVSLGALMTLPIYGIARRLYGPRVALVAVLLVAIFPALSSAILYWGTMTEPLFLFLVYNGVWASLVALESDRLWAWALCGALFALAYLSRPEGLVWFIAFGLLLVGRRLLHRRPGRWRTLGRLALYVGAFALLAAPYAVFLWQQTDSFMLTGKLAITHDIGRAVLERNPVLYDQVTASLDEQGEILWWSPRRFQKSILDIVREDPQGFVERTWRNAQQMKGQLFASTIFPLFLFAPILLGWFRHPWTRPRLWGEAVLWFGVLPVLSFLPFHVEVRFFAPAIPALLIWLAAGAGELASWAADTLWNWRRGRPVVVDARWMSWHSRALALICALLVLLIGFVHVRTIRRGLQDLPFAHKEVGLWLREHTAPDASIMSRDLAVSLYAQRGFVASPRAEYEQWLDYARRKGATHVVVDERELRVLRPYLAFLLDIAHPPSALEPISQVTDRHGVTIVYRLKD
ncbi:MAG: glycosyltransferase family 39 protein [Chloroflexi bacterium]|nr:glycosyltransferase family 39 protein [Chloroflexota bacterium]